MSRKIWSMSTTVRNPNRIKDFLYVLEKMNGKEWTRESQIEYQIRLIQERFYTPTDENLTAEQINLLSDATKQMTYEKAKEILIAKKYVDSDMRGRTSYKPLEKWGLAFIIDGKITITTAGLGLLDGSLDLGDVCFKSLLKWQYPNSIDNEFTDGYNIKPFVGVLQLINKVNTLCKEKSIKTKGISKEELGIFALSLTDYRDIEKTASRLLEFREEYEKLPPYSEEKKLFMENYCVEYLKDFSNATIKNIRDYTDNIIRYFRLTRYLYIRGAGYYIDIEPRRMKEILMLLKTDNASALEMDIDSYINYLSDYNLPMLVWETKETLITIATDIENELKNKENVFSNYLTVQYKIKENLNVEELKDYISYLRKMRTSINNLEIKQDYSEYAKIDEAIYEIKNIFDTKGKASIELEKWTNIALNIINDAKLIKPNYPVGDDNEPTFTAPSNVPDIECYYDNFSSICEVTMLTNRAQWYNEGQPVQRHLRDFENNQNTEEVYCLFIAPRLHRDTVNMFWVANKYEYEGKKQKIVPMSSTQLITILEYIKELKMQGKTFTNDKLKLLYDNIINQIDEVADSNEWVDNIGDCIEKWKKIA